MQSMNTDLADSDRANVIDLLNHDVIDAYLLLVKTKKYHWDVVGSQFLPLHHLLEEQNIVLSGIINSITDRIKSLGGSPVGIVAGCFQLFLIKEHFAHAPLVVSMVERLVEDRQQIVRNLHEHVHICHHQYQDRVTADLLTDLIEKYAEMNWILRVFIQDEPVTPADRDFSVKDYLTDDWIFGTAYKDC